MERRELLKKIAILTGAAVVGGEFLLTGCKNNSTPAIHLFSEAEISLLDEIAETIIPATDTPGAKAAELGKFMDIMVKDCYTVAEQKSFKEGLQSINTFSVKQTQKPFLENGAADKEKVLIALEKEAKKFNQEKKEGTPAHYYTMMKQLTLWGFFTSKTGMTETLRHNPVPGEYKGDVPYKKGEKAWSE
jgi:hypothetical protein